MTLCIDGVKVYQFVPNHFNGHRDPRPTIIFYHGGGFTSNSVEAYELTLIEMAKLLDVQIFSPEYRLAPENPYPACLDDCLNSTIELLAKDIDYSNFSF